MLIAALFGVAPATQAFTQGRDVRYGVHLDPGIVKLGASASLVIQVLNAKDARVLELPKVDGLRFGPVGRPSSRSSIVLRGGRREESVTLAWVVPVTPERTGEFTIPWVRLEVDGAEITASEMVLKVREDLRGAELGLFRFIGAPERVWEGEVFPLEIEFGWDAALPSITRAELSLPWWSDLPGVLEVEDRNPPSGARLRLPVNSREEVQVVEIGEREVEGTRYRLFRLRKLVVATRSGTLSIPTSFLEFVQTVERSPTIFSGPDRTESYFVGAPGFEIAVRQLPEEGRPFDFSGAVGRISARASENRRDVDAGDSIKLTVEWSGHGNLEFFEAPDLGRLEAFADFRVYGSVDRYGPNGRQVVYDLAPRSGNVSEIPGVPLVVFDTELGKYVTIRTEPIPIRVRALEGSGLEDVDNEPRGIDIRDLHDVVGGPAPRRVGWAALGGVFAAILLGWLGLRTAVRRRGDPGSLVARRRRGARRKLARELGRAADARAQSIALAEFLAARTGEHAASWDGRDPVAWAREHEASERGLAAARELGALQAELDRNAWAGSGAVVERARVLAAADRFVQGGF